MKKLSNKGFTLIELLATILIIGLVLGVTAYGIISSVGSAKETGTTLSIKGIKEAARTYSSEYTDDTWKESNTSNNIYFCTTIQELINKGLLDKKAKNVEDNKISLNDYIAVIKDKTTKVIKKEEILNLDNTENEAYRYCTGSTKPEDTKKFPTIDSNQTYTDTIEITKFTDAEFKTKDGNVTGIKEKRYEYGLSSSNFTEKGIITNQECTIEGLKQNETYYVRICMTSDYKTDACSKTVSITTKQIVSPKIELNKNITNSIKITYDDTNIKGAKFHYFKSSIDATSDKNVSTCKKGIEDFNCESNSNKSIAAGTWYKVTDKEVVLTYSEEGDFNQITVTAETRDKSNNSSGEIPKTFNRLITTFSRGIADTINKQTNDIKKTCLANINNGTCKITSPTIEKAGYQILGWNTNSNATALSWTAGTSKDISKSETYYPILKSRTYTITYNNNGGSGCTSKSVTYNSQIGDLCTPKRTNYIFIGWYNSEYKDKPLNYYADTYPDDLKKIYGYDANALYNHYLTYGKNEGRRIAQYMSTDIYNYSENKTVYAGWKKVNKVLIKFSTNGGSIQSSSTTSSGNVYKWQKNSNNIISRTNANGSTYSDTFFTINYGTSTGADGLPNYNNSSYLNVSCVNCKDNKNGRGVPNEEWICLEGTCKGTTYNQSSVYNASDFCDASSGDCTVVLGVNWEAYKEVNDYRCVKDSNGNSQTDPRYYITSCVGEWCYYTRRNCESESERLAWGKVVDCSVETISGCRYDTFKGKKYNSLRCVGGYCCDGVGCTNYSIDRCYLNTNCAVKPTTYTATFNANGGTFITTSSGKFTNNNQTWTGGGFEENKNYYFRDFAPSFQSTPSNCTFTGWYSTVDNSVYYNYFTINGKNQEFKAQWYCPSSSGGGGESNKTGYLKDCTCNTNADCGTAGSKYINLRCDTNTLSRKSNGGKYMCTWGANPNSPNWCWY